MRRHPALCQMRVQVGQAHRRAGEHRREATMGDAAVADSQTIRAAGVTPKLSLPGLAGLNQGPPFD